MPVTAALKHYTYRVSTLATARLTTLLQFWGVRKGHDPNRRNHALAKQPAPILWDLYEAAWCSWRRRIARSHPDRGGNSGLAAELNAAWDRTRELFARRKIGDAEFKPRIIPGGRYFQGPRRVPDINPLITCGCGCGRKFTKYSPVTGQERRFCVGHYHRKQR